MSFAKALDLLRLTEMARGRHLGVSLDDIRAEFGCTHRTAQRMARALERLHPDVEILTDPDRHRRWRLRDQGFGRLQRITDGDVAALDLAIRTAEHEGDAENAKTLGRLRDRIMAAIPSRDAARAETDAEALLEAQGFAARPGPRSAVSPVVAEAIARALKGPFLLRMAYRSQGNPTARERTVAPHGLLIGPRRYLVARDTSKEHGPLQNYRIDRIETAECLAESFVPDPDFDIGAYAARAFGAYHDEREFGRVVWRFVPRAAEHARGFRFHPRQTATDEPDGSLTVSFETSGWLEMCWHLYQWGDAVEVIEPAGLRKLVEGYRRGDFPALP